MNSVGVYMNRGRVNQKEVMLCMSEGVRNTDGITQVCNYNYTDEFKHDDYEDIVVIFGRGSYIRGENAGLKADIIHTVSKNPKKFLVTVELGHIERSKYWNMTINGMGRESLYTYPGIDRNRIDDLGFKPKPFTKSGNKIVIAKQIPRDLNVLPYFGSEEAYDNYIAKTVSLYRAIADAVGHELIVREHPRIKTPEQSLDELLSDTRLLVTWSSTSAMEAIMEGVQVSIGSKDHLAYELSSGYFDHLPAWNRQKQILNRICHAQWSFEEMKSGKCWDHIMKVIKYSNASNKWGNNGHTA